VCVGTLRESICRHGHADNALQQQRRRKVSAGIKSSGEKKCAGRK